MALAVRAGANSTVVEVLQPQESSRHVRLTILFEGKPHGHARVEFYRYELGPVEESEPRFSLTSNPAGRISSPSLPAGHYHVVASAENSLRADLYLDVSPGKSRGASAFSMRLVASPFLTPSQQFADAEQMSIKQRIPEFKGVIYDQSGAVVAGTNIEVLRKHAGPRVVVSELKSDPDGRFSIPLAEGTYIAFFSMQGFQTAIVPFEVTREGQGDLHITLQLGATT